MDKWSSGQRTGAVVCVGFTSANIKGKEGLKGERWGGSCGNLLTRCSLDWVWRPRFFSLFNLGQSNPTELHFPHV